MSTDPPIQRRDLTEGPLVRTLLRLALPLAAGMALHSLYNMVDAFWLGKVSKEALAAPGVSMPLTFLVIAVAMGFGQAGTALVAQYIGAKDPAAAERAAGQTMLLLGTIGLVLTIPMLLLAPQLLRLVQVPEEVIDVSLGYLRVFFLSLPCMCVVVAYSSTLRALGDTLTMVGVSLLSNIVNLVLDPLLIFGLGPFPALGPVGAAIASVLASLLSVATCLLLLARGHAGLKLRWADFRPDRTMIRDILRIGVPSAVTMSSNSLGFATFQVMINSLGASVIGAYTVGFRILNFFSIPGQCVANAAAPVVGQALGAGKKALARKVVAVSVAMVAAGMFLPYLFITWKGQWAARAFTHENEVIVETARFFYVVPASNYFFNVVMVLSAAFYGAGKTAPVMWLSILRQWLIRVPASWLLGFVIGWKSLGVYGGMTFSNIICAILTYWWFRKGDWARAAVPVPGESAAPGNGP